MSYVHVYSSRINWENEPSIASPINATNLNKMDYALKAMDDTFASWDITKANQSDLLLALKDVTYDTDTGEFVFTWWNGTTMTVDLNIEKIPVSFSMDEYGVITMETEDGSTYTADVGALIKTYTFTDSSEIDFTVTTDASGNKTVTAGIVAGSIDGTKLVPNYLADCTTAKEAAENAAEDAELSVGDAEAWAVGTRGGVPVPVSDPTYNNNAEYWAHHTSASLAGLSDTDINNPSDGEVLKYNSVSSKWENGQAAAGGGSTVEVTTIESILYGQTVTLSDGVTTFTSEFDNAGVAVFSGVTITGNATISATAGAQTVTASITMPYYGNYTAVLSSFTAYITVTFPGSCTVNGQTSTSSPHTFTVNATGIYPIAVTVDGVTKTDSATITSEGQTVSKTIEFGTINLTYSDDFRGATITCENGGTTISKTAPSVGNTMVFYPPTTGTWTISGTYSGDTYSTSATITSLSTPESASLETIPDGSTTTPTDDIAKWLKCAGISDKAYTTLSEVMADGETFNALLGDSNACAYMARSTTFATTLCADALAMSMIGRYDVCFDALLSNATWASAIVESNYWSSVFDISVPKMTSNTAPSGVASANAQYDTNHAAWMAFDKTTAGWCTSSGSTGWLKYKFTESVNIRAIDITNYSIGHATQGFTIQGSNDDTNWVDLYSNSFSEGAERITDKINNDDSYLYYRVNITSGLSGNNGVGILELNYFGRKSSSEKVHGATGESAYILVGGNPVTIADPSTLAAGTYTFYSTVAKDPDNLSADYSKTIRITKNVKEVALMPDGALYWYGYKKDVESGTSANGWSFPSYTLQELTYNTNEAVMSTTAANTMKALCSRVKYSPTKVKIIVDSRAGSNVRLYASQEEKILGSPSSLFEYVEVSTTGLIELSVTKANVYLFAREANANASLTIKAMFIE